MDEVIKTSVDSNVQLDKSHILVCYASAYGTTQEVAEYIGKLLRDLGAIVDVKRIQAMTQLEKYDAVFIGSAIQYDRWMPAARNLVKNNSEELKKIPVACFYNCMTLAKRNEKTLVQANKYASSIYALNPEVKPVSVGQFAGAVKLGVLPIVFKLLFYFLLKYVGQKEGDYRDWTAIKAWTNDTAEKMFAKTVVSH